MISTILGLFTGAGFKWLLRRILELGGVMLSFAGFVAGLIAALPPEAQQSVYLILTRDFERLSVAALWGLLATIGGLAWNWRSTFRRPPDMLPEMTLDQAKAIVERQTGRRPDLVDK